MIDGQRSADMFLSQPTIAFTTSHVLANVSDVDPSCLQAIFERFDKDRSGKIDATELRDALYSLGYMVPPSVLEVLISRYTDGSGRRPELSFDSFVE